MACALMQQGSKGPMRDLDYVNPRPPKASSALPPEIRKRLGLDRATNASPSPEANDQYYRGNANADPKKGQSGAGTDWVNPNGHAFVRKGSGVAMSKRASRLSQMSGAAAGMIAKQSKNDSKMERLPSEAPQRIPSRESRGSREGSAASMDCGVSEDSRAPSREHRRAVPVRVQSFDA